MSRPLPERPNLEQLRKQAKDLVKAHKQGDASVCPILRHLSRVAAASDEEILKVRLLLSEAQHALAREYGFKSWAVLIRCVRDGRWQGQEPRLPDASAAAREIAARSLREQARPQLHVIPTLSVGGPKCHLCDEPASVHVTERSAGKMTERHYCAKHAEENVLVRTAPRFFGSIAGSRAVCYPVKYTVTLSLTPEQIQRNEPVPVTLPDGSIVKIAIPWGVMDGTEIIARRAKENYGVRFVVKIIRPPAQR